MSDEVFNSAGNPRDLKTIVLVMGSGGSVLKDTATSATDVQIRAALRELPASELAKVQEAMAMR